MIIVCNDPCNVSGSQRYAHDVSQTWQQNLFDIFPNGLDPRDWRVVLNGVQVEPEDLDMSAIPAVDDVLVMVNKPLGVDPFTIAIMVVVAIAAALAVSMLSSTPNLGQTSSKTSSNNSFTGQTNLPRAYQAWPDIFGRNRIYPDIISPSVVEYVNNVKTLRHYFWVGRGSHTLTDVKYAESDVTDYANSAYTIYGDGVAIPEVIEQFANEAVDGQELLGINEGATTGPSVTALPSGSFTRSTKTVQVNIHYSVDAQAVYDSYMAGVDDVKTYLITRTEVAPGSIVTLRYDTYDVITAFTINNDPVSGLPVDCNITMVVNASASFDTETLTGFISIESSQSTTIGPF